MTSRKELYQEEYLQGEQGTLILISIGSLIFSIAVLVLFLELDLVIN